MRRSRLLLAMLPRTVTFCLLGCTTQVSVLTSASAPSDSGPPRDSASADVGPPDTTAGHYFSLERVELTILDVTTCAAEGVAFVRLGLLTPAPCVGLLEPIATYDLGRRGVELRGRGWVEHGTDTCDAVATSGSFALAPPSAGTWTLRAEGRPQTYAIEVPAERTEVARCEGRGLSCGTACQHPCLSALECDPTETCADGRCTAESSCESHGCVTGQRCVMSGAGAQCDWAPQSSIGSSCADDVDCGDDADCVRYGGAQGTCEIRCTSDRSECPPGQGCGASGICRTGALI